VERQLIPEHSGEGREPAEVIARVGPLPLPLPEQELAVDQVERGLGVGAEGRKALQIRLGRDPLPCPPALPLVDPNHCRELRSREPPDRSEEGVKVGVRPLPPEVPEPVGRFASLGTT
jgi:hypothetical protein